MKNFSVIAAAAVLSAGLVGAADKPKTNAAPVAPASAPATHKASDVVAHVGNRSITWGELDVTVTALAGQFARRGRPVPEDQMALLQYDVLEQMVTHELALQEAKGHEPKDIDDQVKKQLDAAKLQVGGEEAFTNALAGMNTTEAEFTSRLRDDIIVRDRIEEIAAEQIKISTNEVRKFYDDNLDRMKVPERVRASHILIAVPKDATDEVKKQKKTQIESVQTLLKGGDKFADVARKYSEDPVSAQAGGDLGYFVRGQMVPEFEAIAFSLSTNTVSDVVTTKFGYHILLITAHDPAGQRSFDEVKADIEKYLRSQQERDVAAVHVKKLRDTGKYEILIPKPEAPKAEVAPSVVTPPVKAPTVETKPVAAPKP